MMHWNNIDNIQKELIKFLAEENDRNVYSGTIILMFAERLSQFERLKQRCSLSALHCFIEIFTVVFAFNKVDIPVIDLLKNVWTSPHCKMSSNNCMTTHRKMAGGFSSTS